MDQQKNLTSRWENLSESHECKVFIALGDDSEILATRRGVRPVNWSYGGTRTSENTQQ